MTMTTTTSTPTASVHVRRLAPADLDAVVAIDAKLTGRARRPYFERRLHNALRAPQLHTQLAVDGARGLFGFVLGRELDGEFGRAEHAMRFESLGVDVDEQGHGAGLALIGALADEARKRGARDLRTTAAWTDHQMLRFLERAGFRLTTSQVLECPVSSLLAWRERRAQAAHDDELDAHPTEEHHGTAALSIEIVTMSPEHIKPLARIDAKLTGRDRTAYFARKLDESVHESGVAVSLAARHDGMFVGFLSARVDLGDNGRTEAAAVLDTIGVDPDFAGRGVAHELLAQLAMNLHALRVERVETMVSREDFALLQFLYRVGFEPSPRLAFALPLA